MTIVLETLITMPKPCPELPESYTNLPFRHIKVSHVPESSPTPTPVVLLTLNRPQQHNAFTDIMRGDIEKAYELFEADDRVKCIVITGAGKSFCAGADLSIGFVGGTSKDGKTQNAKDEKDQDHRDGGGRFSLAIHRCSKPTVAAVNGSAVGIGATGVLPACIRVAYAKAKFGFVFSRRGLIMEAASSYFLPRLIGHSRALHVITTGSVYPADSPLFGTLFSELLPTPEATLQRALELADDIAKNTSVVSTKIMRDLMFRGPDSAEATHLLDSRVIHGMFGNKDNLEGVQSFLEKRPPKFEGRMPDEAPAAYPWWSPVDIGYKHPPKDSKL